MFRFVLILVSIIAIAIPSPAATIRVERDGSADFVVIQDAVDAAASGDTILIGPGRYFEGKIVTTPGWTELVRVLVTQEELTLIGSGRNETIVGPSAPWTQSSGYDKGIEAGPAWGNQHLRIEKIGFENIAHAISAFPMPEIFVRECNFSGNNGALMLGFGSSGTIDDCEFRDLSTPTSLVLSHSNQSFTITNCTFILPIGPQLATTALNLQMSDQVNISNCQFIGGSNGIYLSGSDNVSVRDCVFRDQNRFGVRIGGGRNFRMSDCSVSNADHAWVVTGYTTTAKIERTDVAGMRISSLAYDTLDSLSIQGCILDKGTAGVVWGFTPSCDFADFLIDMTNNDWGTTVVDSIEAWISGCEGKLEYVPYVGMEVGVEKASWGSMKALFR